MHFYSRVSVSGKEDEGPHLLQGAAGRRAMPQQQNHHRIRLVATCVVLFLLVGAHTALISLWASHGLDKHLFSIAKLSEASQVITIATQATITILLVLLSFAVQGVAADQIIRRRQTVAALQDNLDSWKGLGASLVALWRGRRMGARLRARILIVTAFFAAASVLQITTPSVITVNTTNATALVPLTVDTMPGELINLNFSYLTWTTDTSSKTIIGSLPLTWNQSLASSSVGAPAGLNGSVFFSTLDTPQNETLVFSDPYARLFTVGCASIPRNTGDSFNATYTGPGDSVEDFSYSMYLDLHPTLSPAQGVQITWDAAPFYENEDSTFVMGGEKPTADSPPTFVFDDVFKVLPMSQHPYSPPNYGIAAFMLLSTRSDALEANSTLGIEAPVIIAFEAEVFSWVHNSSLTEAQMQNRSFRENATFTIYGWPIACSLHVQNVTAEVLGNNQLVRTVTNATQIAPADLLTRPAATDPLESSWEPLIEAIYFSEFSSGQSADSSGGEILPLSWLENIFLPILNGTSLPGGGAHAPSLGDRLSLMSETLERLSALAYGLIIQSFRSQAHDGIPQVASDWAPVSRSVSGQQLVLRGKFTINGLQVIIGTVCVLVLVLAAIFAVAARAEETPESHTDIVRDGGVIDLISLANGSSVPAILAGGSLMSTSAKQRREVAERTLVVFGHDRLDTPQRVRTSSESSRLAPQMPPQPAFPEPGFDPMDMTAKALQRISFYAAAPPTHDARPWGTTLKPYYLTAQIVLASLVAFSVVFIIIHTRHTFDHHLWPVDQLGKISQITSTMAQLWSIGPLLILAYVVQAIASDKSIRRRQTVAELHDSLGAWGGLGASLGAMWRGARYTRRLSFDVIMVTLLFTVIAVLHIAMPTVVTVDTVTRKVATSNAAFSMPGRILDIGWDSNNVASNAVQLDGALTTMPYLYGSRNMTSVGLPPGLNDTIFFSAPYESLGSDVIFNDQFASQLSVHCGVVPRSEKYDGGGNPLSFNWFQPEFAPEWNETQIGFTVPYGYDLQDSNEGWQVYADIGTLQSIYGDYVFGGPKASRDAPMTIQFKDVLGLSHLEVNASATAYSTVGFTFISIRNDSLRLDPKINYTPPIMLKTNITNWAWVEDPSLTLKEQQDRAFNDTAEVTFYIYPLACSLYQTPVNATVRGDGKLISVNTTIDPRIDVNATPYFRTRPTYDTEIQWMNLTSALYGLESTDIESANKGGGSIEFSWMEYTLLDRIVNGTGLSALEDSLAYMTALSYALLVQSWRTELESTGAGGSTVALKALASNWVPSNVTLNGTTPRLYARLKVEGTQLFITFASTIVLFLVTFISTYGHASAHVDPVVRDGGVIDILSLMADSSLPAVIGEGADDDAEGRDGRRVRAERTLVSYSIAALDVPDQLQRRVDGHIVSSSSKEATTPSPYAQTTI